MTQSAERPANPDSDEFTEQRGRGPQRTFQFQREQRDALGCKIWQRDSPSDVPNLKKPASLPNTKWLMSSNRAHRSTALQQERQRPHATFTRTLPATHRPHSTLTQGLQLNEKWNVYHLAIDTRPVRTMLTCQAGGLLWARIQRVQKM